MYYVYVLISRKDNNLYIGCTRNLESRIKKHNSGKVKSTLKRKPFDLIHYEKFDNKIDAFNRERFLKSLWSGRFKMKLKDDYLNKHG